MSFISVILLFFLAMFLIGLVQVLWVLFRGWRTMKKMMNGQMNQDGFQQTRSNRYGNQRSQQGRTTKTDDGVTIIDQREPEEANKKIFAPGEGEYVEFTEES